MVSGEDPRQPLAAKGQHGMGPHCTQNAAADVDAAGAARSVSREVGSGRLVSSAVVAKGNGFTRYSDTVSCGVLGAKAVCVCVRCACACLRCRRGVSFLLSTCA
jgi:hypothetical protein